MVTPPPLDAAKDLAAARAAGSDADRGYIRGRIAIILWFPGLVLCAVAGAASGIAVVGIACFAVFVAGLWLFAFRPGATSRFLRKLLRRA